ncbi:hypothetical protein SDC9_52573 [bioreactor metagenome]|uniref:Outer membrane efflux protein n=1 Tax=bioreactor metagenome TaxID=1076179 RepID=A0A644WW52_9ZZZZ
MKKLISAVLAIVLMSSGLCFAADTGTATANSVSVSLDTIGQIWTDHSADYAKIKSDLAIAKATYDKLSGAADELTDVVMYDSTGLLYSQYASLSNSRDQAKCAYDVAAVQYSQKIENAVLAAKLAFLTCWQDGLNMEATQANLTQKQTQLKNYADGLGKGYISQKTYDTLESTVNDLKNALAGLQTKKDADTITLKSKLGLHSDASLNFTFPELNESVFSALMKIDEDADLEAMLANSVNLKALQITYDSMAYLTHNYATKAQIAGAKLSIETARTNLETSFTLLFRSLMRQYEDLQSGYRDLSNEKDKLGKMQGQVDRGFVSALALSNLTLEYSSMEAAVKGKESALYGVYLSYLNTVAGN